MEFKFFDSLYDGLSIDLEILEKNSDLYNALLLQHKGIFNPDDDKFGNSTDCTNLFLRFIELAKKEKASIAITPEYSCPWSVVYNIVSDNSLWPAPKKLLVLGCESITPAEIIEFRERNRTNANLIIHFDDKVLNNGVGNFFDPICYIFNGIKDGELKLIVLIQFKTRHMGVRASNAEQKWYIPGKETYILRNEPNSIYLFTIICSDVAAFNINQSFQQQTDNRWDTQPYVILNLQMNSGTSHSVFKSFKEGILRYKNKDLISLNWATGSQFTDGNPIVENSKSAIMFRSAEVDYSSDQVFLDNHKKGFYYTYKIGDQHFYYLNSKGNVFLIQCQKPDAGGINPSFFKRSGPVCIKNYTWDNLTEAFDEVNNIDDGLITFLNDEGFDISTLKNSDLSVFDKERLVNLSTGILSLKRDDCRWQLINKLKTFCIDDDDVIRRITAFLDDKGNNDRIKYLRLLGELNNIIKQAGNFPDNFSIFRDCVDIILFPKKDGKFNYKYNLITRDEKHKATVIYLGVTDAKSIESAYKKLQLLFDDDDNSKKRVLVWYKRGISDEILCRVNPDKPTITDETSLDFDSILKS